MLAILLIVLAVVGIIVCLSAIANYFLLQNKTKAAERAYRASNLLHEMASMLTDAGRDLLGKSQVARPPDSNAALIAAILNFTSKKLPKLNPGNQLKNDLRKRIKEAILSIEIAQRHATDHNWQDGFNFIQECAEELSNLEGCVDGVNSIFDAKEIEEAIARVKEDAEKIAAATNFTESTDDGASEDGKKRGKTYYEILEINKSAGLEEIKKSYRRLAGLYHPDKYAHLAPDMQKQAEGKFKEINEAFSVLSDPDKRRVYDQTA